jgi:PAS domain S-box-containing protein
MTNDNIKILLVEDNKLDQMAFKRLVRQEGLNYNCSFAESVKQAENFIRNDDFNLIIADYMLGDGTGFDILKLSGKTPVIFCTGAGDQATAIKAIKQGASDYLIKDPSQNHLKVIPEVIKKVFRHKSAEDKLKNYYENLEKLVQQRTEQLESEKTLLTKTLSGMNDGVIAVNTNGEIVLINRSAQKMLRISEKDIRNENLHNFIDFFAEKSSEKIDCPVEKILKSSKNTKLSCDKCIIKTENHQLPISFTASPMYKIDGNMMGVVVVFRDISKEQEVEKMKDRFISSVSHELKTPVTSIKAYADMMLTESGFSQEDLRKFLSIIVEQSNRLTELIDRILEISKISSSDMNISFEPVNVSALTEQVTAEMQMLAYRKNINLQTDLDYDIPIVSSNESRLHSVLTNLMHNAVKFTPQGGTVKASVKKDPTNVIVEISDTGIGIAKKDLIKIFDRFYRVRDCRNKAEGTGLGLAIVKETVDLLNGRLEVTSTPGEGTAFKIYLPLKKEIQNTNHSEKHYSESTNQLSDSKNRPSS